MESFVSAVVLIVIVIVLIRFFSRRGKRTASGKVTLPNLENPRDFLERASSWFSSPIPLSDALTIEHNDIVERLISALQSPDAMDRKTAVYALGQIGFAKLEPIVEAYVSREPTKGGREAGNAALVALRIAPVEGGHSELERRRIIDKVYYNL